MARTPVLQMGVTMQHGARSRARGKVLPETIAYEDEGSNRGRLGSKRAPRRTDERGNTNWSLVHEVVVASGQEGSQTDRLRLLLERRDQRSRACDGILSITMLTRSADHMPPPLVSAARLQREPVRRSDHINAAHPVTRMDAVDDLPRGVAVRHKFNFRLDHPIVQAGPCLRLPQSVGARAPATPNPLSGW